MASETTKNEFSMAVEKKAVEEGISHLSALAAVMTECHIEVERVAKHINKSLKDKIEAEGLETRMLKGASLKGANIFDKV
jgi:hypothetical protein